MIYVIKEGIRLKAQKSNSYVTITSHSNMVFSEDDLVEFANNEYHFFRNGIDVFVDKKDVKKL